MDIQHPENHNSSLEEEEEPIEEKEVQIVWISEAAKHFDDEELLELLKKSRANNLIHGITGLLLYDEKSFMQIMEGKKEEVNNIFENRIKPSKLHQNVTLLMQKEIMQRNFENWSMGFMSSEEDEVREIPGFREFNRTHTSFLGLAGDKALVMKIVEGFHKGRWHLGQPTTNPDPKPKPLD